MSKKNTSRDLLKSINSISYKDVLLLSLESFLRVLRTLLGFYLPLSLLRVKNGEMSPQESFIILFLFSLVLLLSVAFGKYMDEREKHLNLLIRQEASLKLVTIDTQDYLEDDLNKTIEESGLKKMSYRSYGNSVRSIYRYYEVSLFLLTITGYLLYTSPLVILPLLLSLLFLFKLSKNEGDIRDSLLNGLKPLIERSNYFKEIRLNKNIHRDIRVTNIEDILEEKKLENRKLTIEIFENISKKMWFYTTLNYLVSLVFFLISALIIVLTYSKKIPGNMDKFALLASYLIVAYTAYRLPFITKTLINRRKGLRRVIPVLDLLNIKNRDEKALFNALNSDDGEIGGKKLLGSKSANINFFGEIKREKIEEIKKIEFKDVSYVYPGKKYHVIENVCFTLENPGKVLLTGFKGSGKTTIILLLLGLLRPTRGNILINDIGLNDVDMESYREKIAVMFSKPRDFNVGMKDNIILNKEEDSEKVNSLIKYLALNKYREINDKRELWDKEFYYTKGEKEKIALSRVLLKERDLSILDEPSDEIYKLYENKEDTSKGIHLVAKNSFKSIDNPSTILLTHKKMVYLFHSKKEFNEIFPDIYTKLINGEVEYNPFDFEDNSNDELLADNHDDKTLSSKDTLSTWEKSDTKDDGLGELREEAKLIGEINTSSNPLKNPLSNGESTNIFEDLAIANSMDRENYEFLNKVAPNETKKEQEEVGEKEIKEEEGVKEELNLIYGSNKEIKNKKLFDFIKSYKEKLGSNKDNR